MHIELFSSLSQPRSKGKQWSRKCSKNQRVMLLTRKHSFFLMKKIWRFHRRKQPWRKTRHNYEAVQTKLDESKQSGHSKHACNSTKRVLEWRAAIKWTKSFMKRFPLFVYSLWLFSCPPNFHVFAKVNRTNMKRARQWALLF